MGITIIGMQHFTWVPVWVQVSKVYVDNSQYGKIYPILFQSPDL